jgi:hypothetical protein
MLGRRIDALKIPALRAKYSLTENATSPFQAEPTHYGLKRILAADCGLFSKNVTGV